VELRPATIAGIWTIDFEWKSDERGRLARVYDEAALRAHGLATHFPEHSDVHTTHAGTVRGMHFQREPHGEIKIIHITQGAVYDVLVDVRPGPAYGRWFGIELSAGAPRALYVEAGFAHGYQTLTDDVRMHYLISTPYAPASVAGFRYDSPALAIPWPLPPRLVSERDRALPAFG
jgi:dTDP-4-dehydrorhamnose 3,5-epimerase